MKRLLVICLLLSLGAFAQDTTTTTLGLTKPGHLSHTGNWDTIINANSDIIDSTYPTSSCLLDGTQAAAWNGITKKFVCTNISQGTGVISGSPTIGTQVAGNGTAFASQTKPVYDTRDWMTCDGVTDVSAHMGTLLLAIGSTPATMNVVDQCLLSSITIPVNITLDFSSGGAIKARTSSTSPGGATFDSGGSTATYNSSSTSCAVTVTPSTAGETFYIYTVFGFGSGATVSQPTSSLSSDVIPIVPNFQSNTNVSMLSDGWLIGNATGGARTFTFTYSSSTWNSCGAYAIAGVGPIPALDGLGASAQGTASPMSSGAATFQSGSFLLAYGGQHNNTETCTAGGSFTQPAGNLGQVGSSGTVCTQYIESSSSGAVTATQSISSAPTGLAWTYNLVGIRPGSANIAIQGGIVDPDDHQIFYNALPTQGTISFPSNRGVTRVPPEWWGASVSASGATNAPAIQAAITAALGSGIPAYNKTLDLSRGIYNINAETKWYGVRGNQTSRFLVDCGSAGGLNQTTANLRIMDSQGMAYGRFSGCQWSSTATNTNPSALLDIDWNGTTTPNSLHPQVLTFYDNSWVGNGTTDVGLLISKSGGIAQGSNIYCVGTCIGQGFSGAVWQVGGNNTGRNVGRFYALNALNIGWQGDMQACPLFGLADYGGGYIVVENSSFECTSPLASYLTSAATAVDVYGEATQGPVTVSDTRSEDLQLIHASTPRVLNSVNTNQSYYFYSPVTCLAGGTLPLNSFLSGSDLGSDGALYQITVHGTSFGGLCLNYATSGSATTLVDTNSNIAGSLTSGTFVAAETVTQTSSGATATVVAAPLNGQLPVSSVTGSPDSSNIWTGGTSGAVWTPSASPAAAFVSSAYVGGAGAQMQATIWGGTGKGEICGPITGNTTTTLTFTSCVTNFSGIQVVAPDSTSQFVIEPYWAGSITTIGDFTVAKVSPVVIGGDNVGTTSPNCVIQDVKASGGIIQCGGSQGPYTYIRNLSVSRTDWYGTAGGFSPADSIISMRIDGVKVVRPYSANAGVGTALKWSIGNRNASPTIFTGPLQTFMGTSPLIWSCGGAGGGVSCNDVGVGGRSNPNAGTTTGLNYLEIIGGAIGPQILKPFTIDQNGTVMRIDGGFPTGAGMPGDIALATGNAAGSGVTITAPTDRWLIKGATGHLFANVDNTYDIGASGANRPRTIYVGTSVILNSVLFANLGMPADGTLIYCSDCKNVTDDTTGTFDSVAAGSGHGTTVLRENGAWRVH